MKKPFIAVIDYDISNITSMLNALVAIGATALPTRDPAQIEAAEALILPGVGAFRQGMDNLRKYNLLDPILQHISRNKPFLGVCLGMQLLMEESEEFGITPGLGVIKGKVRKLAVQPASRDKLPHIGWNALHQTQTGGWSGTILEGIPEPSDLYFVHSFAVEPDDCNLTLSVTDFGGRRFCSALQRGAINGCQFHPEKSGVTGLSILRNFVTLAGRRTDDGKP